MEVAFTVFGRPAPKGSVKSFIPRRKDGSMVTKPDGSPMVVSRNDAGQAGEVWAAAVATMAANARAGLGIMRGPVEVQVEFCLVRPKGHYGTGRNAGVLKASAPAFPASRPDADKLLRAILDALTGVVFADDGQVVRVTAAKRYDDPERAEVRVRELDAARPRRQEVLAVAA